MGALPFLLSCAFCEEERHIEVWLNAILFTASSEATGMVSIARIERPPFYRGGSASTETTLAASPSPSEAAHCVSGITSRIPADLDRSVRAPGAGRETVKSGCPGYHRGYSLIMGGLLPIMWTTGTGADVMKRIAAPMIGGMVSSTILTLIVIPVLYFIWKDRTMSLDSLNDRTVVNPTSSQSLPS
ncbi:MAG: efflux RND transporter permease subunit [Nitrospirae bacterium]|nr:efflux RND transporter permease subunit [Nitrospirota bacterium]